VRFSIPHAESSVSSDEIRAKGKPVIVRFARACLCNSRAVEGEGAVRSLKNILVAAAVTGRNNFYRDFGTSRIFFLLLLPSSCTHSAPSGPPNVVREGMQTRRNCVRPRGWLTKVGGWTHLVGWVRGFKWPLRELVTSGLPFCQPLGRSTGRASVDGTPCDRLNDYSTNIRERPLQN